MIAGDTKVSGPLGAIEARLLKEGDPVWSWSGDSWRTNRISKITRGQARKTKLIFCFDGVVPMVLRCDLDQRFRSQGGTKVNSAGIRPGQVVKVSEGQHVFGAHIGAVESQVNEEPQATYSLELKNKPHNVLANGFLVNF